MKKFFSVLIVGCLAISAWATDRYVAPTGDNSNDGLSWETAKLTVSSAVNASSSGDNVLVAAGTYNECVSIKDGVNIRGGYNASTGTRDMDLYQSILDGTDLGKFVLVKYSSDCTVPTYIEGMILQNTDHTNEGGGAFIRGNVILDHCIIRNCNGGGGGGVYAQGSSADAPAVIQNTTIELCNSTSSGGGAYLYANAVMDGCIVRGCGGKYGAIRVHKEGCIVKNCVVHNNSCTIDGWPDSGGIFNETGGQVINCTVVNNYGAKYAGVHSVSEVYNSIFWGNKNEDGFADPANFISAESGGSSHNYADQGFDGESFANYKMSLDNMAPDGPNFNNPTTFVGIPTNAGEIAAMQAADYSLLSTSPLINVGLNSKAPETDILGVTRPISSTVDIGAYEYDPDAAAVAVEGLAIYEDSVFIIQGQTGGVTPMITPSNATNKRLTWSIDDTSIAEVSSNGAITGISVDTTIVRATTVDGGFTASAVVVILPIPPVKYPDEVLAADTLYNIEDYTIPSFIPFLVAKEAARIDSLNEENDLTVIKDLIEAMNEAIANLRGKEEPYNLIANIHGDPKTRMAFCWFTNGGIEDGEVQLLAKADADASDFESGAGVVTVEATPTTTKPLNYAVSTSGILKAANLATKTAYTYVSHKALAENLTPGTTYSWRVGYEGHWSDIAQFTTEAEEQGDFSFIYMSDSHVMDAEYVNNARWCSDAVIKNEKDVKFCVFPGDFVETGTESNSEWEWERWFEESIRPVLMQMPVVVTDGNHDDSNNLNYDYHFNTDWEFAQNAKTKPQFSGITYSFVYGDVLFLVYSLQDWWRASGSSAANRVSSYLSTDVANWFKEQIALHPNTKYRVTLAHKNIFSGSGHSVDEETPMFRDIMLPIFKECEIDLALQGHDHCYEVIGPVNPDTRKVITAAVSNVETVSVNTNTNMTGLSGGTFCTDDGTLYFIGATCGRKRYYPYSRDKMESYYDKHQVTDYFDLFTSMFGQPGAPSYTRLNVSNAGIELKSYKVDDAGNSTLYNTINVVRSERHGVPTGYEDMAGELLVIEGEKFVRDGQILIRKNGRTYNTLGVEVEK